MSGPREAAEGVVRRLRAKGHQALFAGGCVRDHLRGVEPHDYDVATDARPEQVAELFPGRSDLVGKSFGVVIVREGGHPIEVATFRQDGPYLDGRHPSSVTFADAAGDAGRRDFTVNALFWDPETGEILDYVGGRADLGARLLRAVGDPGRRFDEDRLRMLRAVRFAANLGFEIEGGTWAALRERAAGIVSVSAERIRDELTRWLTGPDPARGLDLMDGSGLLGVLLPEVAAQKGVDQPPQFHPEGDVYTHVRLMLAQLRGAGEILAWSVLLHDIGKVRTRSVDRDGRIRFNGHEVVGEQMAREVLARLRFSNAKADAICACVGNHMTFKDAPEMRASTLKRLLARENFDDELELHRIDCRASHGDLSIYDFLVSRRTELSAELLKPEPLLRGKDVMERGVEAGPRVGELLREAYELQLDGRLRDRDAALAWLEGQLRS